MFMKGKITPNIKEQVILMKGKMTPDAYLFIVLSCKCTHAIKLVDIGGYPKEIVQVKLGVKEV